MINFGARSGSRTNLSLRNNIDKSILSEKPTGVEEKVWASALGDDKILTDLRNCAGRADNFKDGFSLLEARSQCFKVKEAFRITKALLEF